MGEAIVPILISYQECASSNIAAEMVNIFNFVEFEMFLDKEAKVREVYGVRSHDKEGAVAGFGRGGCAEARRP